MSFWTSARDSLESAGSVAGNYFLPGSGLVTSRLVSDGAKQQLGSQWGQLAMLGSGIAGGINGNMANYGAGYDGLSSMFNSTPTDAGMAAPTASPGVDATVGGTSANTSDMAGTSTPTTQPMMPNTMSSGTNIPPSTGVDWANAPDESAAETARLGMQDANATGVPVGASSTSPEFLKSLMSGNFGDAASAAGNGIMNNKIASIYGAGSLYDMYAKNQMAKKQQDLYNQNRADIMGMYAPGSAEYNSLMNEMSRKDAAAGRNSQYGARAVDLAGKIASYKTTALANMQNGQNGLANQSIGNQFGMMNTPWTLAALTATQKSPITG